MTEVKMYKANDGTLFEHKWKCETYEKEVPFKEELESAELDYRLASERIAPILTDWDYVCEDNHVIWLKPRTEKSLLYLRLKLGNLADYKIGEWYCAVAESETMKDVWSVYSLSEMLDGVNKTLKKLGVNRNDPHA